MLHHDRALQWWPLVSFFGGFVTLKTSKTTNLEDLIQYLSATLLIKDKLGFGGSQEARPQFGWPCPTGRQGLWQNCHPQGDAPRYVLRVTVSGRDP